MYDEEQRDPEIRKFYVSQAWKKARDHQLKRFPLCIKCQRPATMVDHIVEIRDGGERLDPSNLQSMCKSCHNTKTAQERAKREGGKNRYNQSQAMPKPQRQILQTPIFEGGGVEKKRTKPKIDWESIKSEFENTNKSLRALASAYNVHHTTISKKIKNEGWTRIGKKSEVTTTVTKEVTSLAYGEAWSDDAIVEKLRKQVTGEWGLLFFDVTYAEMKKKYWTYDYFSLLLAANFYQDAMEAKLNAPDGFLSETDKGDKYISAEYNLHISATANFMKITKELGLSPLSRAKASVKVVEKIKENSLFEAVRPKRDRKIEF